MFILLLNIPGDNVLYVFMIDIGYIFPLAGHYIPHKVRKFLNKGISAETVATRMDVPVDYVKSCL